MYLFLLYSSDANIACYIIRETHLISVQKFRIIMYIFHKVSQQKLARNSLNTDEGMGLAETQ